MTIQKSKIIKVCEKSFLAEDKVDPFTNREYAKESKRLFGLLKVSEGASDFPDTTDRAIYDIVTDIFREVNKK